MLHRELDRAGYWLTVWFVVFAVFHVTMTPGSDPPGPSAFVDLLAGALLVCGAAMSGFVRRPGLGVTVYGTLGGAVLALATLGGSRWRLDFIYGGATVESFAIKWIPIVFASWTCCRIAAGVVWRIAGVRTNA